MAAETAQGLQQQQQLTVSASLLPLLLLPAALAPAGRSQQQTV
jgi:hypothetical protein